VRDEGMCLHPAVHNRRLMAGLRPGVFDGCIGGPVAGATHDEDRLLQRLAMFARNAANAIL
jgi:hypothetical protein